MSMNKVTVQPITRTVSLEAFRVQSEYHFLTPAQTVDKPKERET